MSLKYHIIQADESHISGMVLLLEELFAIEKDFDFDPPRQARGLQALIEQPETCVLCAVADGKVIAMCTVQTLVSTAEGGRVGLIEDLIVKEEYRHRGIGEELLNEAGRWSRDKSLLRLQLLADKNNCKAIAFYDRHGWETTDLICLRKKAY